ncbi:OmpA family protein [Campylobacter mucosalis]|uniref:OmpA family protein n=1 Tax=Campylobacter mucosalis TaxID=202 RepID=UPI0014704684|nr:OmpA family protein [Campylobacter mucosalis]
MIKKIGVFAIAMILAGCASNNKNLEQMVQNEVVDTQKPLTLFVIDTSESMTKTDKHSGLSRMETAKKNLKDIILTLDTQKTNLGLISFGYVKSTDNGKDVCSLNTDIKATANVDYFNAKTELLQAQKDSYTPLAKAIDEANSFIKQQPSKKVHLIIISDGCDTCGGSPMTQLKKLESENPYVEISTYVLGYEVEEYTNCQLDKLGKYYDIKDSKDMAAALNEIGTKLAITDGNWENGVYSFNINFDFDSSYIKPEFTQNVQKLADYITKSGNKMQIQGHTDNIGNSDYNTHLSQRRANAVKEKLIELGVDSSKLEAVGYGQDAPKADNSTKEGRYENRRVEAHVIK